ncbi:hypothetical protein MQE36_08615 [Zhouia spongiae]|uniref:Lipoprotein n=1 Tax=Zhouia spongiae TaxID=2202721 RepID=A0ABY3YSJ9_9FLAO|nr:hypothetical protein [Zhouia spongiae]UNZ00387.1 hypothetical protein MQE36_08615 [Zhouia spongiae]
MKAIIKYIKQLYIVIVSATLLHSCSIYRSQNSSIDDAVSSRQKVLVLNTNLERFHFKRLLFQKDSLYGVASKNSKEAKRLSDLISAEKYNDKYLKIYLPEKDIYEIRQKNKSLSTAISIAIPVSAFTLAVILAVDPFEDISLWSD